MTEAIALNQAPDMAITQSGFTPQSFDQAWRYAQALAATQFVPATYQGKPNDCFVAIDISTRLGVHPLMFLQNSYIVHGRPAMEAKLVQSLVNHSGLFEDPLEYEVVGDDPEKPDYKVRAHATRKSTGTVLYGPWITWKIVKGEGWDSKSGSKWKTIPEVMFGYRAASWFCNRHCPEVKMGFMTGEEAEEVGARKPVNSVTLESTDGTRKKFGQKPTEHTQEVTEDAEPAKDVAKETTDDDGGTEAPQTDPQSAPGAQATAGNAAALTAPDAKDQDGAIDGSATTAESSSDEPQYMCKGCGVSPTKVNVRKVKGKDKFFCDACMSSKIAVIK